MSEAFAEVIGRVAPEVGRRFFLRGRILSLLHAPDEQQERNGVEQGRYRVDDLRVGLGAAEKKVVESERAQRAYGAVETDEFSHHRGGYHVDKEELVDLHDVGISHHKEHHAPADPPDGERGG